MEQPEESGSHQSSEGSPPPEPPAINNIGLTEEDKDIESRHSEPTEQRPRENIKSPSITYRSLDIEILEDEQEDHIDLPQLQKSKTLEIKEKKAQKEIISDTEKN